MASEKQVKFISDLIEGMKLENVGYLNKDLSHLSEENGDRERAERAQAIRIVEHCAGALGHNMYDYIGSDAVATPEEAIRLYEAKLDELAARDWAAIDTKTASNAIDALKNMVFWTGNRRNKIEI